MAIKNSTKNPPHPPSPISHHLVDILIKKAVPANFKALFSKVLVR